MSVRCGVADGPAPLTAAGVGQGLAAAALVPRSAILNLARAGTAGARAYARHRRPSAARRSPNGSSTVR
jgi:hypothetical protein